MKCCKTIKYITVIIFILFVNCLYGQKPPISMSDIGSWPRRLYEKLSNDGSYLAYTINSSLVGDKFVVQSTNNNWRRELTGSPFDNYQFSEKGKLLFYELSNSDTLCISELGTDSMIRISDVQSFKYRFFKEAEFLVYMQKKNSHVLKIRNLLTGYESSISSVVDFSLCPNSSSLFIIQKTEDNKGQQMLVFDLITASQKLIWKGIPSESIGNYIFDNAGEQMAFMVKTRSDSVESYSLHLYQRGKDSTRILIDAKSINGNLVLDAKGYSFSRLGTKLYITFKKEKSLLKPGIDVWSYTDPVLQSRQLAELGFNGTGDPYQNKRYQYIGGVISLDNFLLRVLEDETNKIARADYWRYNSAFATDDNDKNDNGILLMNSSGNTEWNWNITNRYTIYYYDFKTGEKEKIKGNVVQEDPQSLFKISPDGKYIVYYDSEQQDWISYNLSTKSRKNITKNVKNNWTYYESYAHSGAEKYSVYDWVWWLPDGSGLFVQDHNGDIWLLHLDGTSPKCITNFMAKRNNIRFDIAGNKVRLERGSELLGNETRLYLFGKQNDSKVINLYFKDYSVYSDPVFKTTLYKEGVSAPAFLIKARDKDLFLVLKGSVREFPNLYSTEDFKSFSKLTDIHPERKFNWLQSELVKWKTYSGKEASGILYKPEDFDSTKKYPIIFPLYEESFNNLNQHLSPQLSLSYVYINIPYFVSNGYLVCIPNIRYELGNPGASAYDVVASGAEFLGKKKWVDEKKMALQGQSFGGYEVNYIITQTNLFAAACATSGMGNLISDYGNMRDDNDWEKTMKTYYEVGQMRMGVTLWERPDLYIKNSPIFYAHRVHTPLLSVANKDDVRVHFTQGYEFFTGLRRLGKRVWMLQYDKGGHGLDGKDFTVRIKQFFDHYLKDSAAPRWMLQGIPAKMKGRDKGFDLVKEKGKDGKWITPQEGGVLTDEEKIKVEALKRRKPITIKLE